MLHNVNFPNFCIERSILANTPEVVPDLRAVATSPTEIQVWWKAAQSPDSFPVTAYAISYHRVHGNYFLLVLFDSTTLREVLSRSGLNGRRLYCPWASYINTVTDSKRTQLHSKVNTSIVTWFEFAEFWVQWSHFKSLTSRIMLSFWNWKSSSVLLFFRCAMSWAMSSPDKKWERCC